MAAAPRPLDALVLASPELALVDADLAAQLRADLSSGEAFRPREVARPAHLALVVDVRAAEEADVAMPVVEPEEVSLEDVDILPPDVALPEDVTVVEHVVAEATEIFAYPSPTTEEPPELPDYIVLADDDVVVDPLPDYVVVPDAEISDSVPDYLGPAHDEVVDAVESDEVHHDEVRLAQQAQQSSDYPILPDLDERSEALEETEAALRRIREQLGGDAPVAPQRSRLRRRFTLGSGLCVAAVLGTYAADVGLGIVHAPGWPAF